MDNINPQVLIQNSLQLFSLPDIYFQISEMINDPRFSIKEIGQVISKDPALSARLLKIVNSSLYGFQSRVDRVSRAVSIVGAEELKNLVLATSVVTNFNHIPSELVDMTDFWLRSVRCGLIAKNLAKECAILHQERLFLTGLLHDIGSLVFYCELPEKSLKVLLSANHDRHLIPKLEQEIMGFTHAQLGAALLKSWGMPESLHEAVEHYLTPELAQVHKLDTYLINLASKLTCAPQQGMTTDDILASYSDGVLSLIRLDAAQVNRVMREVDGEFSSVFALMAPDKKFH
jgi:HD-like signal output (HDOD) protein